MSPLYEYICPECHTTIERIRSFAEMDEPIFCKECDSELQLAPPKVGKFVRGAGGWSSPA